MASEGCGGSGPGARDIGLVWALFWECSPLQRMGTSLGRAAHLPRGRHPTSSVWVRPPLELELGRATAWFPHIGPTMQPLSSYAASRLSRPNSPNILLLRPHCWPPHAGRTQLGWVIWEPPHMWVPLTGASLAEQCHSLPGQPGADCPPLQGGEGGQPGSKQPLDS